MGQAEAFWPLRTSPFLEGSNAMMSKSELIQKIADEVSLAKKDVKAVIESLAAVGYKEMKKSGEFTLPGFADRVQGEAGPEDAQGACREGRQGRRLTLSSP
jgi:hypothetical protein